MQQSAVVGEVRTWGRLVKFSHSIFALPFALSMAAVVWRDTPIAVSQIVWILIAIVSARTAAMAFNRLADRTIDADNPRTASRELPRGIVTSRSVLLLLLGTCGIFLLAAGMLGRHCLVLSPLVLLILLGYSLTKRFTRYSHLFLGLALACAPGGVWYALRGTIAIEPVWLMAGVLFWVAGFDILYSCQDAVFDRERGLFSIPARAGVPAAFKISFALHLTAIVFFAVFGVSAGLGAIFFCGLVLFTAVLLSQQRIISPADLSRIDAAFFNRNGVASVLFFIAVLADTF